MLNQDQKKLKERKKERKGEGKCIKQKALRVAAKVAQQLRALTALAEDPSWAAHSHL